MSNTAPWEGADVIGRDVRDLPVALTEQEILQRGKALALQGRALAELQERHRGELKALKEKHRRDEAAAQYELRRLQAAVNDEKEDRPVTCYDLANFAQGICTTIRADTSEVVGTRRLRSDEQQIEIATPLRVVAGPDGKLRRADGGSVEALPFVKPEQCAPMVCRECEEPHGRQHADDCPLHGLGAASLVTRDQCDARVCLECDAPVGERHADGCRHMSGDA